MEEETVWSYSVYMGMGCDRVWMLSQFNVIWDVEQLYITELLREI